MSTAHSHVATLQDRRNEPTSTATIRDRYQAELYKRLRAVKGLVRETVATNDALRLSATLAEARRDFNFESDAGKEAAFEEWFEGALDDEVLEPMDRGQVLQGRHYTAQYVRASSRKGAEYAAKQLRDAGYEVTSDEIARSFDSGVHNEKLQTLYLRNYSALNGITDFADREISRVLSEGIAAGENPREMARSLNDRVGTATTRARTLARTETMHAHHVHAGTRYDEAGVDEVEILTYDPCPQCRALKADDPYPVSEVPQLLPAHPNCVCGTAPVL